MRTVICLSGGLDSTTLLYDAIAADGKDNVAAISFDYGQRHVRELKAASAITAKANIADHFITGIRGIDHATGSPFDPWPLFKGSSQTDFTVAVPEGHYEDPSMRKTFVPNRNMIMLAIASAYAMSLGAGRVGFAAHAGDHAIYPDCRKPFVEAFQRAVTIGNYDDVKIYAPFLTLTKIAIAQHAASLGVPLELTYSCYKGAEEHCGKCGTCIERREAFHEAGVNDPTIYA